MPELNHVALGLVAISSLLSLILLLLKALAKEFEVVGLLCIRVFARLRREWKKVNELPSAQRPQAVSRVRSKRELG